MIDRAVSNRITITTFKRRSAPPGTVMSTNKVKRVFRSIGAVLAGLLAIVLLSIGTDVLMHATRIYPPWGEPMQDSRFVLATAYRSLYAIGGSYIAARLSPNLPTKHAIAVGVIGVLLAVIGAALTWNAGPAYGRKWYPIALILISLPSAWLGGKLRTRQVRK